MKQREFKFRVWEDFGKDYPQLKPTMVSWEELKEYNASVFKEIMLNKRFGITKLQYIGLKDKNGKEIYEGDVLCHVAEIDGKERESVNSFVVEWIPDRVCFRIPISSHSQRKLKVIGNIFMNPELIKK